MTAASYLGRSAFGFGGTKADGEAHVVALNLLAKASDGGGVKVGGQGGVRGAQALLMAVLDNVPVFAQVTDAGGEARAGRAHVLEDAGGIGKSGGSQAT